MMSDKVFYVKIYLKQHLKASYELVFNSEEQVEKFIDYSNMDVDFIRIGDEVIKRLRIRKMVIRHE